MALRHYLLTTDADFERAVGGAPRANQAVQIPVQYGVDSTGMKAHAESGARDNSAENVEVRDEARELSWGTRI